MIMKACKERPVHAAGMSGIIIGIKLHRIHFQNECIFSVLFLPFSPFFAAVTPLQFALNMV